MRSPSDQAASPREVWMRSPSDQAASPREVVAQGSVHGAFAGLSGITTGLCNTHYVYFPTPFITQVIMIVPPEAGRLACLYMISLPREGRQRCSPLQITIAYPGR
ncbi:hypothetical protein CYMTET_13624 [Cymbomonas tetramitiformis]|uniref:Uncharacterized protein n=1 Tax=Cymbomonas tetramitiformis TaxID=36881 RepID=A0AAE0GI85_9CHLO|nr:hypothetical protein CYMTET_13624 [Cymbomonas tetramitiformis]